ncbi:MAG: signal recognition particle-docking protein FtsY [Candidatus Brocadia sp.]|jgi:signal recognition particle-docking protein FtsY|uniref:Signal recognition particle receptor FtsY n=1 Tax=Candidatus Brocadia fulgida TaxID=380242 RepID=A0A0M2UX03_9BACT|nr:MAG: cell division protein [Candidatus Brocadia fulgida]MCC6325727.1 signal recognition particle-docking protein FtsY [Candidatus Brocadia sp.]MCE7911433.1 signal recognition particle-docking protein FtsY [Candidatus Brocadia sp. AMX3]MBV6519852.1 Signal recognition particle receptor FtsY [Candidatus Brocadia fulgida]MDG5995378.1 signal recognition particle-docking protein FtsY [Candidatus Brocadia sp.]
MEHPSKKEKHTAGEKKRETPKTLVSQESGRKQSPDAAQQQGNAAGKPRRSFWTRIKTFTFEPPKKVIVEGDTIRLVSVSSETEILIAEKGVSATTEELAVDVTEAPDDKGEARSQTLITPEELAFPLPEIILGEEPVAIQEEIPVVEERLKKSLEKTRTRFWSRLKGLFAFRRGIDESVLEELEDILIGADIGAKAVQSLMHELREAWKSKTITETSQIHDFIKDKLKESLRFLQTTINYAPAPPTVILVVGVNGVGKTTAIAKLANTFIQDGKKVMVAASDTFRAAAVEQLDIWSKRIGAEIVKHQTGSDPAAVAYDALEASIARGIDVVIVDTAGRLHTHENLMNELSKMKRVISKRIPGAPHEVLMVLDATTGQNALSQAKLFKQAVDVTGIFLAKLDGTAKGGFVLGMRNEINIPVKYVGIGEKADDIEKFDPDAFVNALFE